MNTEQKISPKSPKHLQPRTKRISLTKSPNDQNFIPDTRPFTRPQIMPFSPETSFLINSNQINYNPGPLIYSPVYTNMPSHNIYNQQLPYQNLIHANNQFPNVMNTNFQNRLPNFNPRFIQGYKPRYSSSSNLFKNKSNYKTNPSTMRFPSQKNYNNKKNKSNPNLNRYSSNDNLSNDNKKVYNDRFNEIGKNKNINSGYVPKKSRHTSVENLSKINKFEPSFIKPSNSLKAKSSENILNLIEPTQTWASKLKNQHVDNIEFSDSDTENSSNTDKPTVLTETNFQQAKNFSKSTNNLEYQNNILTDPIILNSVPTSRSRKAKGKSYVNKIQNEPQQNFVQTENFQYQMKPEYKPQQVFNSSLTNQYNKKGKINLNKKKRTTTMKKIIKMDRESRRQNRIHQLSKIVNPPEKIPTLPQNLLKNIVDMALADEPSDEYETQEQNFKHAQNFSKYSIENETMIDLFNEIDNENNNSNSVNVLPSHFPAIHSRRFREYCDQVLDASLDHTTIKLIENIKRRQDKKVKEMKMKYDESCLKAGGNIDEHSLNKILSVRKNIIMGLREVTKHANAGNLKLVVVAPNLEKVKAKGGLDDAVEKLKTACSYVAMNIPGKEEPTPLAFALSRNALGRALNRSVPISCVGIRSVEGYEKDYKRLVKILNESKVQYENICQKYLEHAKNFFKDQNDSNSSSDDVVVKVVDHTGNPLKNQNFPNKNVLIKPIAVAPITRPQILTQEHHDIGNIKDLDSETYSDHRNESENTPVDYSNKLENLSPRFVKLNNESTDIEPSIEKIDEKRENDSGMGLNVGFVDNESGINQLADLKNETDQNYTKRTLFIKQKSKKGHRRYDSNATYVSVVSNPISGVGSIDNYEKLAKAELVKKETDFKKTHVNNWVNSVSSNKNLD